MNTFKEVAHLFLGCNVMFDGQIGEFMATAMPNVGCQGDTPLIYYGEAPYTESNTDWGDKLKPILIPLDKMSEDYMSELTEILNKMRRDFVGSGYSDYMCYRYLNAAEVQFLTSKHYNVFNLPESEFIDATSLTNNPYAI